MRATLKILLPFGLMLAAALAVASIVLGPTQAVASEIKYIVNDVPVTSYDIQRRAAFLKLQKRKGNAEEEMIEQALKASEIKRMRINISNDMVNSAYERFAKGNKLSVKQLDQIMAQTGVTKAHFKEFIRNQMGWGQAMQARGGASSGRLSEQEVVKRMMQNGGQKPSATEYMLQHVIFVVPAAERSAILGKRKREAEALRTRFAGCETTRQFAKGLIDVTVKDLGRYLAPQLPPEWADQVKDTSAGNATTVRETPRGVEFIGVCSSREVSDDQVAQMVFQAENAGNSETSDADKKVLAELREKARIVKR